MSRRLRQGLLSFGVFGIGLIFLSTLPDLSGLEDRIAPYGELLDRIAVPERHATDVVSAVNFDYRAFDTLGEEFILFASVLGIGVVLRRQPDERDEGDAAEATGPPAALTSDAVRVLGVGLVGITICFGLYLCTHGQISPGGGFQGGVLLATAPVVVYLTADARTFARVAPVALVKAGEAVGAGGYVLVGLVAFARGAAFLTNVLPLGRPRDVLSSGTIAVIDLAVGLEVAAAFVLLLLTFVAETLARRLKRSEME